MDPTVLDAAHAGGALAQHDDLSLISLFLQADLIVKLVGVAI